MLTHRPSLPRGSGSDWVCVRSFRKIELSENYLWIYFIFSAKKRIIYCAITRNVSPPTIQLLPFDYFAAQEGSLRAARLAA